MATCNFTINNGVVKISIEESACSDECSKHDKQNVEEVSFDVASQKYPKLRHAAHIMLYARDSSVLWDEHKIVATIMMQMRFDGTLGSPGGIIDKKDESIVSGLNRELCEEINFDVERHRIVQTDHIVSHVNRSKRMVTHFYAKEFTPTEFNMMERRTLDAEEWGKETMGIMRVPLYSMNDKRRGFPIFLTNRFAGNCRIQILCALRQCNILSVDTLDQLIEYARCIPSETI